MGRFLLFVITDVILDYKLIFSGLYLWESLAASAEGCTFEGFSFPFVRNSRSIASYFYTDVSAW
jgi:hypothetical protein